MIALVSCILLTACEQDESTPAPQKTSNTLDSSAVAQAPHARKTQVDGLNAIGALENLPASLSAPEAASKQEMASHAQANTQVPRRAFPRDNLYARNDATSSPVMTDVNEASITPLDAPSQVIANTAARIEAPTQSLPRSMRPTVVVADSQAPARTADNNKVVPPQNNGPLANLRNVTGRVEVNAGPSNVVASNGLALYTGNKVTVLEKSGATLVYQDGCKKRLDANTIALIKDPAECRLGAIQILAMPKAIGESIPVTSSNIGTGTILAGVAAIGIGGVAIAAGGGGGGQSPPISPQ